MRDQRAPLTMKQGVKKICSKRLYSSDERHLGNWNRLSRGKLQKGIKEGKWVANYC